MANHKATKKSARQDLRRRERNRSIRSGVRSMIKALRQAIESGDTENVAPRFKAAERAIRKAASKGVLAKRTADRKVSRLARAANATTSS